MSTEIYLVRHGQSEWNADTLFDRFNGRTDIGLSEEGYAQAEHLARALSSVELAAVYSSPLKRARETAWVIAQRKGTKLSVKEWLTEIECGLWEGLSFEETKRDFPEYYPRWVNDPSLFPFPEGEGIYDVAARVMPALTRLVLQHENETILIVAHMIVNCVILSHYLRVHPSEAKRLIPQRTSALNRIIVEASHVIQVKALDDLSHLYG